MSDPIIDESSGEVVTVEQVSSAAAYVARQDAAALDVQVATAKQYPRSIQSFQSDLKTWATLNEGVALECFYQLPRDGKKIIGPSVRFAELVQAAYGNLVCESQIIDEGREYVVVNATCRDLERNVAARAQVRRNITTREGYRYKQAMIETTIMAASAIARRNAIFQIVPKALWLPIYNAAQAVALGKAESFEALRKGIVQEVQDAGCDMQNVKAALNGRSFKDLTSDDLIVLRMALARIQSGELTPAEAFPDPKPEAPEEGRSAQKATQALEKAAGVENDDHGIESGEGWGPQPDASE